MTLNKRNQTQRSTYYIIPFTQSSKTGKLTSRVAEGSWWLVTFWTWVGGDWERHLEAFLGIDNILFPDMDWITWECPLCENSWSCTFRLCALSCSNSCTSIKNLSKIICTTTCVCVYTHS